MINSKIPLLVLDKVKKGLYENYESYHLRKNALTNKSEIFKWRMTNFRRCVKSVLILRHVKYLFQCHPHTNVCISTLFLLLSWCFSRYEVVFRPFFTFHFACQNLFSQSNNIDDDIYVITIVSRVTLYGQSETFKGAITVIMGFRNRTRKTKSVTSWVLVLLLEKGWYELKKKKLNWYSLLYPGTCLGRSDYYGTWRIKELAFESFDCAGSDGLWRSTAHIFWQFFLILFSP